MPYIFYDKLYTISFIISNRFNYTFFILETIIVLLNPIQLPYHFHFTNNVMISLRHEKVSLTQTIHA